MTDNREHSDLEVIAQSLEMSAAQLTLATEARLDGDALKAARSSLEVVRRSVRTIRKLDERRFLPNRSEGMERHNERIYGE